jgi:hypothetical protein
VYLVSGRVQRVGTVEESQAGRDDPDRSILERPHEAVDTAGSRDGVRVEEDKDVAQRLPGSLVAACGEAEVPAGTDEPDEVAAGSRLDLGPAAAVVDDDDLGEAVMIPLERVEASPERLARAVGDDDDGG